MPTSTMKVKSGTKYDVTYRALGSIDDLTSEQLKRYAEAYLKSKARNFVQAQLNAAEPAIAANINMRDNMIKAGLGTEETVKAFFELQGLITAVPTNFEIDLKDLVPDEASTRGRKAVSVFSTEVEEDEPEETEAPAV